MAVQKDGLGTWILDNTGNSYTGGTFFNAGILSVNADGCLGATSGGLTFAGGTLQTTSSFSVAAGRAVTLNAGGGTFEPIGSTTLTIGNNIAGTGSLTKIGSGTLLLNGSNGYSGSTTISAGTLSLSGASTNNIASSSTIIDNANLNVTGLTGGAITLAGGQTLKGSGNITGGLNVNTGSFLSPGNSPGTFSVAGATSYNGGGTYVWEINNATGTQGTDPGWDWNNITGTLTIGATSGNKFIIDITGLSGASPGSVANFNKYGTYDWNIATASTGISGFDASDFTLALGNFTNNNSITGGLTNGAFSILTNGNNLVVRYTGATEVAPANAYWKGTTNGNWNHYNAGATNWVNGPTGTETNALPASTSNVYFTADSASNLSTTLGQNFTINSLNFTGTGTSATSAVTIGGSTSDDQCDQRER